MQNFKILIIVLVGIVFVETCYIVLQNTVLKPKTAIEIIKSRKSVRHYVENKDVSDKDIFIMLEAAMAAPSAANKQPWEFIVLKDKAMINKVAKVLPYGGFLKFAPLAVVVAGNMDRTLPDKERDFWIQDTSAATQNLLLAAESLGLGAVWTGVYPMQDRVNDLSEILELPKNIIPFSVIIIGYPTGIDKPKNKYNKSYIHVDKF